ncbi:MAG: ABC transporter substrate-binding protein [Alphaproteobacteria bacterium]
MKTLKILSLSLLASTALVSHGDEKSIDVWAWNINVPVLEKVAEAYKQEHPDAVINISDIGRNDVYTKVNVGLQAKGKGLPDAILVEDEYLAGFLANWPNAFANLSELGYDQYANDFPEFKRNAVQVDGQFFATPFDIGPVAIFYRPSFFAKVGVDPASVKTWDDYIAAGKKIKEATGSYMTNVSTDDDALFRIFLQQNGGGYFDKDGNIDFNSPKALAALTLIDNMEKQGIIYTGAKGWDGFVQAIASSKIVALPQGAWVVGTIESQAPDSQGDWAVMPMPKSNADQKEANIGGSNFAIFSTSDNIQATYDFLSFFSANTANQEIAFKGGLYPSFTPVYKEDSFKAGVEFFGGQSVWTDVAKIVPNIADFTYTMDYSIAREEGYKIITEAITTDKEPSKILSDAAKRLANQTGRKINKY